MRPLYRDDNYYPVDVSGNEYNVRVKDNSNDWKYILSFIGIITLLIFIILFSAFSPKDNDKKNDKKQKLNSNINSELNQTDYDKVIQNMVENENGYKEEIIFYSTVKEKQVVIKASGSRMYMISCNDDVLADYDFIEIGIQLYNNLEVNDNIKVIRTIYYNKNKEKLYHDDLVEKINMF